MEAYGKLFGIFISILRESFYHFFSFLNQVMWLILLTLTILWRWMLMGMTWEKKWLEVLLGPSWGGPIVWKGHVLASILCLQCVKWVEKGKRVENVTGWHWYWIRNLLALIPHVFVLIGGGGWRGCME